MTNSYAHVVKGNQVQNVGMEECPNMVLDETCLNQEDFSLCLLGKLKKFASLTNLKVVLGKEGYANIKLKYMGGFWVIIVFQDDETKKRFQFNLVAGSWFSQIIQAHNDFVLDERVIWVEVQGIPCKWWSRNTFIRIASTWGTLLNGEELKEEGYHSYRICIRTKLKTAVFDYFKMVYRGMTCWVRAIEVPGWVPDFKEDDVEGKSDREEVPETNFEEVPEKSIFEGYFVKQNDVHYEDPFGIYEEDGVCVGQHVHEWVEVSNDTHESTCYRHFKKSKVPRKGWVPDFEEDGKEGYGVKDGSHEDDMYGGVSENLKDVNCKSDREEVPETNFKEIPDKSIFEGNSVRHNDVHSEDPFGIYEGDVPIEKVDNWSDENRVNNGQEDGVCVGQHVHERVEVSNATHESTCFGHFKKSKVPRKGGSILELIDDLVNVRQTMGY
nr:nucleotide-binding alpha-beta plait domain-containing protein [Tanacetum cinerariifolium]